MIDEQIAELAHEAIRVYCRLIGDARQPSWGDAPAWQKDSAVSGVAFRRENPNAPASRQHEQWLKEKIRTGWNHGPIKDTTKKEHPCIVPYDELPVEQRRKDSLFSGIVAACLSGA